MSRSSISAVIVAAAVVAGATSPLHAQNSPSVDGRLLPVAVDTFSVSYGGNVIGQGIMGRSRTNDARLLQVYEWRSAGGERVVDSLFSDLRSLRPLREVRVLADMAIEASFGNDSIRVVTKVRGAVSRSQSVPVAGNVYSSASLEALAAAAPLGQGYEQEFRLYYSPPAEHGFALVRVRVQGNEAVRDRSRGVRDAWIVAASIPGGGTTYWIDKATRAVLKYDTREGPATIEFRR
jgi:hypothetical protein